jgi:type IV secretory pathway TrbD component
MSTATTNFALSKPAVNSATDEDVWGDEINANFDTIDSNLKVARDRVKRAITVSDTVVAGDRGKILLCDATSAIIVLGATAAATLGDGFWFLVKKTDASANAVTFNPNGSETVDGALTYVPWTGQNESRDSSSADGAELAGRRPVKTNALGRANDASTSTLGHHPDRRPRTTSRVRHPPSSP